MAEADPRRARARHSSRGCGGRRGLGAVGALDDDSFSRFPSETSFPPSETLGGAFPPDDGAGAGGLRGLAESARSRGRPPCAGARARPPAASRNGRPRSPRGPPGGTTVRAWSRRARTCERDPTPRPAALTRAVRTPFGRPCQHLGCAAYGPPLALMALIFFFSAQPYLNSGLGVWDTIGRKLIHAATYGALWFLWWRALGYGNPLPADRDHAALRRERRVPPDLHRRAATAHPLTWRSTPPASHRGPAG